jgi:seryl-tRNA synthetase
MIRNTFKVVIVAVTLVAITLVARPARGGQSTGGELTAALLAEMRGLRAAIEQLASSNARIQLAIGRLQIQEQRVNALLRQHTEVRQRLTADERQHAENEARLADLLGVVGTITEPGERQAITQEIGILKRTVAAGSITLQRTRAEEVELAGLVGAEQGRWTAVNEELDSLDRALRRP